MARMDFNGDGRSDILWRNDDGRVTDWLGTANGGYAPNSANALLGVSADWQIAQTGDFNGDGRDDILWRNVDGRITNWLGTATGGFADNVANAYSGVSTDWQIAGAGDFNGDGRSDILWRNDDGRVTDWLGTANGGYAPNSANALLGVSADWQIAQTGDFNGDGRDDILWRNVDGRITNWLGTATGGFADNYEISTSNIPSGWQVQPLSNGNVPPSVNPNVLNGGPGNDSLIGTGASDTINGAGGNDTIFGLGGNDNLYGAQGRDIIHGGQGNDVISSDQSADNDLLYGESGADTFHFETFTSAQIIGYVPSTSATIMDFQTGIDKIDLHLFGISTNDHNLYWLGEGNFTGSNRIEATFKDGVLQVDYNGDLIPDLILNIVGTISQSDFTYTFDPWGY